MHKARASVRQAPYAQQQHEARIQRLKEAREAAKGGRPHAKATAAEIREVSSHRHHYRTVLAAGSAYTLLNCSRRHARESDGGACAKSESSDARKRGEIACCWQSNSAHGRKGE